MNKLKLCGIALIVVGVVFGISGAATANCVIRFSAKYASMFGQEAGNFSDLNACNAQRNHANSTTDPSYAANTTCICTQTPAAVTAVPVAVGTGNSMTQFAVQTAVGSLISGMMNPADNSVEIQKQKEAEEAKKAAEDQARLEELKKQQVKAAAEKKAQIAELQAKLKLADEPETIGVSGQDAGREALSHDKFAATGSYDTSMFSALKRANCAAAFSKLAKIAEDKGDAQEAKFLNEQSEKVMAGDNIDRPCSSKAAETPGTETSVAKNEEKAPTKKEPVKPEGNDDPSSAAVKSGGAPAAAGSYDTTMLSSSQRTACAANFTALAKTAAAKGDAQGADFLNEQSKKVTAGDLIDRPCSYAASAASGAAGRHVTFKKLPKKDKEVKLWPEMPVGIKKK